MSVSEEAAKSLGVSVEFLEYTKQAYEQDGDGSFGRFLNLPIQSASLLMASASLRRIRDMLAAGFGGNYLAIRFEGDEFVYQGLYQPFLENLSIEPDYSTAHEIAMRILPVNLNTLAARAGQGFWLDEFEPCLVELETELMRLCIRARVNPYDPGPNPLFKGQDETIRIMTERSAELNKEQDQKASGQMVLRRKPLDAEMWSPFLGCEVEAALAALQRIRAFWHAAMPNPWICVVPEDDQGLYDTLYHDLFYVLAQRPGLNVAADELRPLVPDAPPDNSFAFYDHDMKNDLLDTMAHARRILNRLLIADGKSFGASPAERLFNLFDPEIEMIASNNKQAGDAMARRLGVLPEAKAEPAPSQKGRPTGSTFLTLEDVREMLRTYRVGGQTLNRSAFIQHCNVSESTWNRWMAAWNTNWTKLKQETL